MSKQSDYLAAKEAFEQHTWAQHGLHSRCEVYPDGVCSTCERLADALAMAKAELK